MCVCERKIERDSLSSCPGRRLLFRTTTVWRPVSVGPPNPKRAESEAGWHRCHTRTKRRCVCVSYSFKCCVLVIKYKEHSVSLCATERVLIIDHFNQNHVTLLIYLCSNCTPWTLWVSINKISPCFHCQTILYVHYKSVSVSGYSWLTEERVICPHSAWAFIIKTSVSCSTPCVYISMHTHLYIHMCHVELKRFCTDYLPTAGQNKETGEQGDGKTRGEKKRKQDGSEGAEKRQDSVWPWVFWTEVSGLSFGEGVWLTAGRHWWEHKWETFHLGKVMCSSERNAVNAHTHTHISKQTHVHTVPNTRHNLHTSQDTGGSGNNKTHLIILAPADTSHAKAHAWCEGKQTQLPVTTHTVSSAETNRGPGHAETLSYLLLCTKAQPHISTFSHCHLCKPVGRHRT